MNFKDQTYCKNCGAQLKGDYCSDCGQRASVHRITFKETFNDFIESVFSVNAPFFVTLRGLFIQPGKLFKEFLSGKRKTYYKPVAFFILTTVIYLLISSIIDFDPFQDTSVIAVDVEKGTAVMNLARKYMLLNINKMLFIFVFTLGLFLKLFFFKKNTLAEFVAISFYLTAMYTIFTTLNMFYIQYVDSKLQALGILIMAAYFIYAMVSFVDKGKVWTAVKSIPTFLLAFFFYFFLAFGLSYLIVSFKN